MINRGSVRTDRRSVRLSTLMGARDAFPSNSAQAQSMARGVVRQRSPPSTCDSEEHCRASGLNKRSRTNLSSPRPQRGIGNPRRQLADRHIPHRRGNRADDLDRHTAAIQLQNSVNREDVNPMYSLMLQTELLNVPMASPQATNPELLSPGRPPVLSYGLDPADCRLQSPFARDPMEAGGLARAVRKNKTRVTAHRSVSRNAYRVLDAPDLRDDFYLNLMDWSSSNILAIGLGTVVYLWNASTGQVTRLHDLAQEHDDICSVAWSRSSTYLSVGTRRGSVQLWDATRRQRVRTLTGHWGRVGVVRWGSQIMASGSRDFTIRLTDIRCSESYVNELKGHRSEVCGLEWSPDSRLLASGGNDNVVNVWNTCRPKPQWVISDHNAAVKALSWSPHNSGQLASGGGLRDGTIRIWNVAAQNCLQVKDAGAQVCGLHWSKNCNEIVSTHGYNTNAIKLWKCPQLECFATIPGHTMRIVYMSVSPDGRAVVTGAGDETVRFYHIFPPPPATPSGALWSPRYLHSCIR